MSKRDGDGLDRDIDLQEMIAAMLDEVLDAAQAAGWERTEASKAMLEIATAIHMGERGTDPNE